nr:RNA-directed DNA polymerase, eukaryota, reverse transcriptase zinc-binding domain protein [Tanacetum cinerariifolium]
MGLCSVKTCGGNFAFDYVRSDSVDKRMFWDYLAHVINQWDAEVVTMDDFNEVPLGGSLFTWCYKSATKMSKLDRFLISKNILITCPNISATTLDYTWSEAPGDDSSAMRTMMRKLKYLKMDLERDVSKEELKRATIENDFFEAVKHFFTYGDFLKGCNSSFIALISKILDANLAKDFRPISLIGSIYKIIKKILATRLVGVLENIVNEVQSAFIAERQILDGPFILNE